MFFCNVIDAQVLKTNLSDDDIDINSSTNPEGQTALNNACGNILNYYPDFLKLDNFGI